MVPPSPGPDKEVAGPEEEGAGPQEEVVGPQKEGPKTYSCKDTFPRPRTTGWWPYKAM